MRYIGRAATYPTDRGVLTSRGVDVSINLHITYRASDMDGKLETLKAGNIVPRPR